MGAEDVEDGLRRRKKIKFRASSAPSRVRLQAPGVNCPTLGALILLAVHALVEMTGGVDASRMIYQELGTSASLLSQGKIWGLVTHSFLHGSWVHVLLNAAVFYYASSRVGHIIKTQKILILFFVSAAMAAIVQALSQWFFPALPQFPLVGASGGLMGLFLAQTALYPDSRMLLFRVSARNMGKGVLVASLLLFLLTPGLGLPVFSTLGNQVDQLFPGGLFLYGHLYHFVGGVVGLWLIGRLLPPIVSLEELKKERALREGSTSIR